MIECNLIDKDLNKLNINSEEYIDDLIVDKYLKCLTAKSESNILCLSSHYYTHLCQSSFTKGSFHDIYSNETFRDYDLLIYPIYEGHHWSLVYLKTKEWKAFFYDPLLAGMEINDDISNKMTSILLNIQKSLPYVEQIYFQSAGPKQTNLYDCGLLICNYAYMLLMQDEKVLTRKDIYTQLTTSMDLNGDTRQ